MPGCLLFWSAGSLQIPLRHAFCHSGVACRIFQSANWPKATTESRPYRFMRGEKIFETVPEWTIRVAPLKEPLVIPHYNYEVLGSFEDECISPQLAAKKKKSFTGNRIFISFKATCGYKFVLTQRPRSTQMASLLLRGIALGAKAALTTRVCLGC